MIPGAETGKEKGEERSTYSIINSYKRRIKKRKITSENREKCNENQKNKKQWLPLYVHSLLIIIKKRKRKSKRKKKRRMMMDLTNCQRFLYKIFMIC